MKTKKLTIKQEAFCQAYLRFGDKSTAYRNAYSTSNMKAGSINRMAFALFNNLNITSRIEILQTEFKL